MPTVANVNISINADGTQTGCIHYNTPLGAHIKTVELTPADLDHLDAELRNDIVVLNAPFGHWLADPNAPLPAALGTVGTFPTKGRDFVLRGIPAIAPAAWQVENLSNEPILSGLKGGTACEVILPHEKGGLVRVTAEPSGEPEFEVSWAAPKPAPVVVPGPFGESQPHSDVYGENFPYESGPYPGGSSPGYPGVASVPSNTSDSRGYDTQHQLRDAQGNISPNAYPQSRDAIGGRVGQSDASGNAVPTDRVLPGQQPDLPDALKNQIASTFNPPAAVNAPVVGPVEGTDYTLAPSSAGHIRVTNLSVKRQLLANGTTIPAGEVVTVGTSEHGGVDITWAPPKSIN